jgi:transcriptional regulator with XRE-family HTH domain
MEWGASRILALRKHAGMTQAQLAQWLGVTIKQVKYLEHQRRNPSGPTQRLLSILAHQLSFDGMASIQVLGASSAGLKLPATIIRPKPAVVKKTDPAPIVVEPDDEGETPTTSDDAFVWH